MINIELKNLTNNGKLVLLLLSLCLLLAAQQSAVTHELEVFSSEHHHTAECPVCAFDSNAIAFDAKVAFSWSSTPQALLGYNSRLFSNAGKSSYYARAPPAF